jgi:hypothetical protein
MAFFWVVLRVGKMAGWIVGFVVAAAKLGVVEDWGLTALITGSSSSFLATWLAGDPWRMSAHSATPVMPQPIAAVVTDKPDVGAMRSSEVASDGMVMS